MSQPPPKPENPNTFAQINPSRKPKKLLYPPTLTQRHVARLQIKLQRIFSRYRRGEIDKPEALLEGEIAIQETYSHIQADLKLYYERKGLVYTGDDSELKAGLQDTLKRYQNAVFNYF